MPAVRTDLEEKGLPPVLNLRSSKERRQTRISVLGMGRMSYIMDLSNQKEQREDLIREEALEETFELYKIALEQASMQENEQLFMASYQEVLRELTEKGKEKATMKDMWLEREMHMLETIGEEMYPDATGPDWKIESEEKVTSGRLVSINRARR